MNAKPVLFLLTLTLAGVAGARTVPAEEWVGAPLASASCCGTAAYCDTRDAVLARFFASADERRAPAELRVGPADLGPGDMRREAVQADLNLWLRSGLGFAAYGEQFDPNDARSRMLIANYQRMRAGPEFAAEVERLLGSPVRLAQGQPVDAPSDAE